MKLLLISVKSDVSKGGIATWTDHFLASCEKHDIDCFLVNTELVGKRREKGTSGRNIFDEFARTRRIFRDLKYALKAVKHDATHLNTSCGTFGLFRDYIIARRIKKKGIPLVVHFHCDIPYWIRNSISRECLKRLVKLSDKNLVLCESSRRYLEEQFGVVSTKIPNFIDESVITDSPKRICDRIEKIFFVGRVEEAKGAREIYELARRFPEIAFDLAGQVDGNAAEWKKPENLSLIGGVPHERVIEYLDSADLFLFPSHSEGFSVALMECMARGVPAVATDVGANADMLDDGCGVTVAFGDVNAMAQAIEHMQDAMLRREMSTRSVEKVRAFYRADTVIQSLREQYYMM